MVPEENYHHWLFQTILNEMSEGLTIVDEHGIITFCNSHSARYVQQQPENMVGRHVGQFYPHSSLLRLIESRQVIPAHTMNFQGRFYIVRGYPLFISGEFRGGFSIFQETTEVIELTNRISLMRSQIDSMQMDLNISRHMDVFDAFIGAHGSLKDMVEKSQRCIASLGGPRHCVITGETGTGKTTLAKAMYDFAREIKVIGSNAPFIEVNCAQFTNNDIAAMEIFGSDKGSFTGAVDKQGLIELADEGVLFLDEAHALGSYQTMLLRVIESGISRRIGGRSDKKLNVIVIAASSLDLSSVLIPELYQRLAQYHIHLTPLRLRPDEEKKTMLEIFCRHYEQSADKRYGIKLKVILTPQAEHILLNAYYPRNIREFRDVINAAIDAAVPLVSAARDQKEMVCGVVEEKHLPSDLLREDKPPAHQPPMPDHLRNKRRVAERISELNREGLGPRKIAKVMKAEGFAIEYYQVAYRLKNLEM
ncbi:sigma 54-interacting transcriptional regulator [Deltaproteobacteria bacterium OttesenSCG-928-M10]|nr:sigma 54-interacting transcriptional regulator [Deltaproteobacteria bacterium OttesenSCG-928-M10]